MLDQINITGNTIIKNNLANDQIKNSDLSAKSSKNNVLESSECNEDDVCCQNV
jgi:hypothetical protein